MITVAKNALLATGRIAGGSWSFTCSAGEDRLLLVAIARRTGAAVTSVKYGGVALEQVVLEEAAFSAVSLWMLVNPPSGAANVEVTMGAERGLVVGAMCLEGVDQAEPIGATSKAEGQSATPATTIVSAAGDLVVNVMAASNSALAAKPSEGAHQDFLGENNEGTNDKLTGGAADYPGAASVESKWTLNSSRFWTIAAASINAAEGEEEPETVEGKATVSGSGTVSASGTRTSLGKASVSGAGSLSASGTRTTSTTATVSGSGSATAAGNRTAIGSASATGAGSLTATGEAFTGAATVTGEATVSGSGSLSGGGLRSALGSSRIEGTGSASAAGTRTTATAAAIAATGTITATGTRSTFSAGEVTGTSSITAAGALAGEWTYGAGKASTYDADSTWTYDEEPSFTYSK